MSAYSDINVIRPLLARYYAGTSTREEEQALTDFFSNTPPEMLPSEMLPDREIFLVLAAMDSDQEQETYAIPAGLEARLDAFVTSLAEQEKTASSTHAEGRRLRNLTAFFSAVAACLFAAWLVTGVIRPDRSHNTISPDLAEATSLALTPSATDSATGLTDIISGNTMHTADAAPEPASISGAIHNHQTTEMAPEEIDAEVERALLMIQRALGKGYTKIAEAENGFADTNRRTLERVEQALQVDLPGINRPIRI